MIRIREAEGEIEKRRRRGRGQEIQASLSRPVRLLICPPLTIGHDIFGMTFFSSDLDFSVHAHLHNIIIMVGDGQG